MSHQLSTTLRIAAIAACFGLIAPPLMAQSSLGAPGDSAHHRMHHGPWGSMLLKGITLSSTQKTQIDSLRMHYRMSMDSLRKSGTKDHAAMRSLMEAQTADFRKVLNSDQQALFDANVTKLKQHMQSRQQH
jgi:Spy/CpxP family protein refolding chaperone